MHVTDLYKQNTPVISMEFFPPRDDKAKKTFTNTLETLKVQSPDYMSITFGAGGSTKEGSYQTAKTMVDKKISTVAYIAGFGLSQNEVTEVLNSYKDLGIETIFVIRGDKPQNVADIKSNDFPYASDLISFIKKNFAFTIGCAGYPEGHIEAESLDKDIEYLKLKVDNGADYVVSQYFYDNEFFFDYVDKCRANGINVPIIPGIMPVYTVKMTNMLSKICGSSITNELKMRLSSSAQDDKEAILNIGIDFATKQCKDLLKVDIPGIHFYTMNRSKTTGEILQRLKNENLL